MSLSLMNVFLLVEPCLIEELSSHDYRMFSPEIDEPFSTSDNRFKKRLNRRLTCIKSQQ